MPDLYSGCSKRFHYGPLSSDADLQSLLGWKIVCIMQHSNDLRLSTATIIGGKGSQT